MIEKSSPTMDRTSTGDEGQRLSCTACHLVDGSSSVERNPLFKFCVQEWCVLAYKASERVSWWFDTRRTCACVTLWRSQRGLVSLPRGGWDSPASLAKTLHFQRGGAGCTADWGTKIPPTTGSFRKERGVRLPAHFSHSLCDKKIFSPKWKKKKKHKKNLLTDSIWNSCFVFWHPKWGEKCTPSHPDELNKSLNENFSNGHNWNSNLRREKERNVFWPKATSFLG